MLRILSAIHHHLCRPIRWNKTLGCGLINITKSTMEKQQSISEIKDLLATYQDSLNQSDVAKALSVYSTNGLFMPTMAPSAEGTRQLEESYTTIFKQIKLNVEFTIHEIDVNGEIAYARTSSKGHTLIHATGQTTPEENRELFIFIVENGTWKIFQYMFNKTS